jgi:hypothetical protein
MMNIHKVLILIVGLVLVLLALGPFFIPISTNLMQMQWLDFLHNCDQYVAAKEHGAQLDDRLDRIHKAYEIKMQATEDIINGRISFEEALSAFARADTLLANPDRKRKSNQDVLTDPELREQVLRYIAVHSPPCFEDRQDRSTPKEKSK